MVCVFRAAEIDRKGTLTLAHARESQMALSQAWDAQRDLALTSVEQGFVPRLRYVFNRVEYVNNDPELPVQR